MLPLYWIYLGCLICTAIKNIEENYILNRVCFLLLALSAVMIFYGMLHMMP
jgi:hypothetical protein